MVVADLQQGRRGRLPDRRPGSHLHCALAQALCTDDHLYGIRWYPPEAFWAAASILIAGVVLSSRPRA
jgi:hypothetical protein